MPQTIAHCIFSCLVFPEYFSLFLVLPTVVMIFFMYFTTKIVIIFFFFLVRSSHLFFDIFFSSVNIFFLDFSLLYTFCFM